MKAGQRYTHGWIPVGAEALRRASIANKEGGFSINKDGKSPSGGYMVGIANSQGGVERTIDGTVEAGHIQAHAKQAGKLFDDPNIYQGAWKDEDSGKTFLDASRNVSDLDEAMNMAGVHDQLAIWDVKNNKEITVTKKRHGEVSMSNDKSFSILTPRVSGAATKAGKLSYWKQILPEGKIKYNGVEVDFSQDYMQSLIDSFQGKALDQTAFQLAPDDNSHSMDPERYRGDVGELRLATSEEAPGLYARIDFPNKRAAASVLTNPKLGVSARIREGIERVDGKTFPRAIIHVLGTLDPKNVGMSPWQPVDLSVYDSEEIILDLSNASVEGTNVSKKVKSEADAEVENMSDEELATYLAGFEEQLGELDAEDTDDDTDDDTEDDDKDDDSEIVSDEDKETVSMSNDQRRDLDLATATAERANKQASAALKRMAAAEWKETRAKLQRAGVPPVALDLATPVLNRPDPMVIDLSNTDDEANDLDVSKVVTDLLDMLKGTIDMSNEVGHSGEMTEGDDDADSPVLDSWDFGR